MGTCIFQPPAISKPVALDEDEIRGGSQLSEIYALLDTILNIYLKFFFLLNGRTDRISLAICTPSGISDAVWCREVCLSDSVIITMLHRFKTTKITPFLGPMGISSKIN